MYWDIMGKWDFDFDVSKTFTPKYLNPTTLLFPKHLYPGTILKPEKFKHQNQTFYSGFERW